MRMDSVVLRWPQILKPMLPVRGHPLKSTGLGHKLRENETGQKTPDPELVVLRPQGRAAGRCSARGQTNRHAHTIPVVRVCPAVPCPALTPTPHSSSKNRSRLRLTPEQLSRQANSSRSEPSPAASPPPPTQPPLLLLWAPPPPQGPPPSSARQPQALVLESWSVSNLTFLTVN